MADAQQRYTVWWDQSNGVARTDGFPGAVCTLPVAMQVTENVRHLGRRRVLSVVDVRPLKSNDRASSQHFMNARSTFRAVALVADAPVSRMIANFFLGVYDETIPTRMFAAEDQAIYWLQRQHE